MHSVQEASMLQFGVSTPQGSIHVEDRGTRPIRIEEYPSRRALFDLYQVSLP